MQPPRFNPMEFKTITLFPDRLADSAWISHIPFGMFLVEAVRPAVLVELGTEYGVSYCAFCQAAQALDLNIRSFAVDTWAGDQHTEAYGQEVLHSLREHHNPRYGSFSSLVISRFDDALDQFTDGEIDLLHIDGYHAYESVSHDFRTWLPKVSDRGVILLHDINERSKDFGAWRLWDELSPQYPSFELEHGHGLGLLATGKNIPDRLRPILEAEGEELVQIRRLFSRLGSGIEDSYWKGTHLAAASGQISTLSEQIDKNKQELEAKQQELEAKEEELRQVIEDGYQKDVRVADLLDRIDELESQLKEAHSKHTDQSRELAGVQTQNRDLTSRLAAAEGQVQALQGQLDYVFGRRSWRLIASWWRLRDRFVRPIARPIRRARALARTSIAILRQDGIGAFANRLGRWLRGERRFAPRREVKGPGDSPGAFPDIEGRYAAWIRDNEPDDDEIRLQRDHAGRLAYQPRISVVMPVKDPPPDVLQAAVSSVLSQTYSRLELCIADASEQPEIRQLLTELEASDPRIHCQHLQENLGISGNSNAALSLASGEFVALMDHDDVLAPFALYAVAQALNANRELDILYSDEDKLNADGNRVHPFLKPDWSPELLHSSMYVGHLTVYRKALIDKLGGFRSEYDGSQDYDLLLRASEVTDRIHHIPQVLYHWRMISTSAAAGAKKDSRRANLRALEDALERRGTAATVLAHDWSNEVIFAADKQPLVSIIIPTDDPKNARLCVQGILANTTYSNLEVILVTSTAVADAMEAQPLGESVKFIRYEQQFNFSRKCNLGAEEAKGAYLVFLNDDVTPLTKEWIERLLGYAMQPGIGGVSPKLIYEDDTIQYAGLVTNVRDLVGTAFHQWHRDESGYYGMALCYRNVSVLTGACLMLPKEVFNEVGGWDDENTPIANSDLDISFRLREAGYRLVYDPFVELRHVGHQSLGGVQHVRADDASHLYMLERWGGYMSYDPFFTPGMRALTYHDASSYDVYAPPLDSQPDQSWADRDRYLLMSHDLSLSGAPLILFEIARYLHDTGSFVTVLAPSNGGMLENYQDAGIPVIVDEFALEHPEIQQHFWAPFDLILPNTVLGWKCVRLAKSLDKSCVWLIQESEFGVAHLENIGEKATGALNMADEVIVPSTITAKLYRRFRPSKPITVIHYGIRDPELDVAPDPPFERIDGKLHIVISGTLEFRKGADVLVNALHRLPRPVRQAFEVYMVGRHMFPEYLAQVQRDTEDLPGVHIVGEVSRPVSLAYIKESDILVCASREETGPIVVMEAMALGKAVISSRVGAAAEIIRNHENGILIDVDDSSALAEALATLASDRDFLEILSQHARATFEQELTVDRYGEMLTGLFQGYLGPN